MPGESGLPVGRCCAGCGFRWVRMTLIWVSCAEPRHHARGCRLAGCVSSQRVQGGGRMCGPVPAVVTTSAVGKEVGCSSRMLIDTVYSGRPEYLLQCRPPARSTLVRYPACSLSPNLTRAAQRAQTLCIRKVTRLALCSRLSRSLRHSPGDLVRGAGVGSRSTIDQVDPLGAHVPQPAVSACPIRWALH